MVNRGARSAKRHRNVRFGSEADIVGAGSDIRFTPQERTWISRVCRVLTPGGHYLFSLWDSHRHNPFGRIAHEIAGSFFPNDPPQFYNVPFSYYQIDPIKESLKE